MKLLIDFIILNILNVIIQTVKSLVTVKCGKELAAIVNAIAFGLYTVVTVYMMCELPLETKAFVVALCNLVGVYVVKYFEEKARKDKLWKVELTIPKAQTQEFHYALEEIPHNYVENVGKYTLFNVYCATQKESALVKDIASRYKAKYFATESKVL